MDKPCRPRPHTRGVSRSSRTQGWGCDGRGWRFRRERRSRTGKSCGPDTLTPVSSWRRQTAGDGGNRAGLAGESTEETVTPSRAGMPDVLVDLWWLTRVFFYILHARLWVHWAPGIPHALCWAELNAKLGLSTPRERGLISINVIARSHRVARTRAR